jgi:integrase
MQAGTNARVVSDLLGHATVSFTLQTYSHPDAATADGAMTAVDVALGDAIADR